MPDTTPRWSPWLIWVSTIVILAMVIGLVIQGYQSQWTGFGVVNYLVRDNQQYTPAKTLWDWLGLLIVPIAIAGSVAAIGLLERRNDRRIADGRIKQDREIADERAQDAALQAYLEQMSKLLLDKDKPLRESVEGSEVRSIARAWTLTVLRRLNGERKGVLLRFLYESAVISKVPQIVVLVEADLEGAYLRRANLGGAILTYANLTDANLRRANLQEADLQEAILYGADLTGANLRDASLQKADLTEAHLYAAILTYANLKGTYLGGANLLEANLTGAKYDQETKWPEGFDYVSAGAILGEANKGMPKGMA